VCKLLLTVTEVETGVQVVSVEASDPYDCALDDELRGFLDYALLADVCSIATPELELRLRVTV
jgi:hypothetical protein